MYTISQVAQHLNISAHTLRYYEKERIISPNRNEHGERLYTEDHLRWLKFVMKLKQTQMPIAKIRAYAQLFLEGEHTASSRLQLLEEHRISIKQQIETLLVTEEMLDHKIASYKDLLLKKAVTP
ncbi:MerR family transcriptional regulator [Priestia koreensis]|uniref:MerR family transcriptional regulator n=1 Tax=Priestia koreensis TaxID=284581 RepID=UPI00345978DF